MIRNQQSWEILNGVFLQTQPSSGQQLIYFKSCVKNSMRPESQIPTLGYNHKNTYFIYIYYIKCIKYREKMWNIS